MRNKLLSAILSFSLLLTLLLPVASPIVASAEGDVLLISSKDDLIELIKNCSYDLYSKGKTFLLTEDIDLGDEEISPIPIFSGKLDGAGHVIKGLRLSEAVSPMGLVSILDTDGVITNLTVMGSVSPEGDALSVGGIVGENRGKVELCTFIGSVVGVGRVGGIVGKNTLSGSVISCLCGGEVVGEEAVGGIVGRNEGLISSCENRAKVNTIAISPTISLDQINVSLTVDISKLPSLQGTSVTDVGGIAGYSTGIILSSKNGARVGYPHIGYNVGGIAGRSSGHINGCVNNAEVFGRKDVGGIVGQMEPYTSYELSEDLLLALKGELDRLNAKLDEALGAADGDIPTISTRIDSLITNIEGATDSLELILGDMGEYGDDMTGEINRLGAILSETVKQLSAVTEALPEMAELLGSGIADLEGALADLDSVIAIGISLLPDLVEIVNDGSLALESIGSAFDNLSAGLDLLKGAIEIDDQAKAEEALDDITDSIFNTVEALGVFTDKLGDSLDAASNNGWMDNALDEAERLTASLTEMTEAFSSIYDATIVIKENISVNWNEITAAGEDIIASIDYMSSAMADMDAAMTLMESGMAKLSDGFDGIMGSIDVKDPVATREAAELLVGGFEDLVDAAALGSLALEKLADSLSGLDAGGDLSEQLDSLSKAFSDLASSGIESADALSTIALALKTISDNLDLDVDGMADGATLVIGGVKDMGESLHKMRSAISSMNLGMASMKEAMSALGRAVSIDDEAKIAESLDSLLDATRDIADASREITESLKGCVDIMREAKLWGDDVMSSLVDLTEAAGDITDAILGIEDGIASLKESVDLDFKSMKDGLSKVVSSLSDMADAAEHMKNTILHVSDTFDSTQAAGGKLSDMTKKLSSGMGKIADAMKSLSDISEDINTLVSYLKGVDPIQLPTAPSDLKAEADKLFIYISKIESDLKALNTDITSMSDELIDILGSINEIFSGITENIVDIIYGLESGDSLDSKVTEAEIDSVTEGKIFASENYGKIEGDRNVGGISGTMGIEYSLDLEDDLSPTLSVTQKKQYRLKSVIHASRSFGEVIAKYDAAGGITGKMDLGLIYLCEAYGSIESLAGNYVGGIAGLAAGRISSCYVKAKLSGGSYVGGIVGSGVTEAALGGSSAVTGCYTMVNINGAKQYFGAISGANAGDYTENYFISDLLAGIDRVSLAGKAEPISYDELTKRRYIPDGFHSFTLRFVADGVVLSTINFNYGESIDLSLFPAIPEKEGHYGRWDRTELTDLKFDTTVSVVYTPYVIAISGGDRGDGRHIFLVEGEFTQEDTLTMVKSNDAEGLTLQSKLFTEDTLLEKWTLNIPKNNKETSRVHLLPSSDHARIFIKTADGWVQADAEEFGSYITFDVSGEVVEIAVVRHTVRLLPIILLSSIALVAIAAVIAVVIIKKKKKI